jgi:hypothetical protein
MYGTTKILSLIVHLVGLIGHRLIESFGPLQLGHYADPTTMKLRSVDENDLGHGSPEPRRFPPPWMTGEHNNACFVVKDARAGAPVFLFRGRARLALSGEAAHQGRRPPHGGEDRQAIGVLCVLS